MSNWNKMKLSTFRSWGPPCFWALSWSCRLHVLSFKIWVVPCLAQINFWTQLGIARARRSPRTGTSSQGQVEALLLTWPTSICLPLLSTTFSASNGVPGWGCVSPSCLSIKLIYPKLANPSNILARMILFSPSAWTEQYVSWSNTTCIFRSGIYVHYHTSWVIKLFFFLGVMREKGILTTKSRLQIILYM